MFPLMVLYILIAAVILWFLTTRLFKRIGSGATKLIEPLHKAEGENEDVKK